MPRNKIICSTADEIITELRHSINDYGSITTLSKDTGISLRSIKKFLSGGDILFSDAAIIIAAIGGYVIYDWIALMQNYLEQYSSEHTIYIGDAGKIPIDDNIYFESIYPKLNEIDIKSENNKEFILTGIQNTSLKKINNYIQNKKTFKNIDIQNGEDWYNIENMYFNECNPYSQTAIVNFTGITAK